MQPFTNQNYFQQTVPVSFNAGGYNPYMRNQMMPAQQDMVRSSVVQPTVGIAGRYVQDANQVTANEVPMDGNFAFFPKEDLSEIYAKCWSADGQIKTIAFKPSEIMDANNTTPNGEKSKIDALGDATEGILSKLDVMSDKINAIEQKLAIKTTKSKASQE